jgi:hypothetical protein
MRDGKIEACGGAFVCGGPPPPPGGGTSPTAGAHKGGGILSPAGIQRWWAPMPAITWERLAEQHDPG